MLDFASASRGSRSERRRRQRRCRSSGLACSSSLPATRPSIRNRPFSSALIAMPLMDDLSPGGRLAVGLADDPAGQHVVGHLGGEGELAGVDRHAGLLVWWVRQRRAEARSVVAAKAKSRSWRGSVTTSEAILSRGSPRTVNRPSRSVVAPSGNADQLRLSRLSVPSAVLVGPAERVDAEDLDLRPDDGFAPRLDDPAAENPLGPELQRDRGSLMLRRELDPGQAVALRERHDVPRIDALARLGDCGKAGAGTSWNRNRPASSVLVSIKVSLIPSPLMIFSICF